ncbi:TetR/AcrR family transcriptional regulator [Anaerovorax odorimutans]|uniref:TetR/AcrR family transcriptional regulator n=1 Tax=Anaerovorax odorimutans TaxID=109327 RepID=UPI0004157D05|nr:TetR/AcrR family transcriptional regulator [Anaerovorax odorimutans]
MTKILTNRDKQAIATKNKIYKVGIKLLKKDGFDDVNITQIAKAAGVSVGTFYHYYHSKLDLFMDLYRNADKYFEKVVVEKLEGLTFKEQILLFFDEYCNLPENDGVELTKKIYVPENSLFLEEPRAMHQVLYDIIEKQIPDIKVQDLSNQLFLIARGVVFDWVLREGKYDIHKKMREIINIFLNNL